MLFFKCISEWCGRPQFMGSHTDIRSERTEIPRCSQTSNSSNESNSLNIPKFVNVNREKTAEESIRLTKEHENDEVEDFINFIYKEFPRKQSQERHFTFDITLSVDSITTPNDISPYPHSPVPGSPCQSRSPMPKSPCPRSPMPKSPCGGDISSFSMNEVTKMSGPERASFRKKTIRRALLHYHPDKQEDDDNRIICQEITKILNNRYKNFKDA